MSRLSREKKREQQRATPTAALATTPIEVRITGAGNDGASVAGVPVAARPGQDLQRTVLDHLHRAALAAGQPVLATVHDERIGYVIPLRVDPDGSSHLAGEPAALPPAAPAEPPASPFPPPTPLGENTPTFPLRAPAPAPAPAPGTAVPPTGEFGPPPLMDPARAHPTDPTTPAETPAPARSAAPTPTSTPTSTPVPTPVPTRDPDNALALALDPDPKRTPTPPRGFDAVAEAVLDDRTPAATPLAEPMARIGEAVKEGRTDTAAGLAERALTEASATLGAEHPEVRRLAELTAYVAYLSGEPERAFRLSLDVARGHAGAGDAEAAYGNVQSAATAWRAVRDPGRGLELGRELITVWTELAAEPGGPAAEDREELEVALTRMDRLTARARKE
ncbi:tetratricopeptide repeat protein [Streptomyces sp. NPDC059477]|uniref:tetratricopeptide repeat protein n=1 Tax=Streptomyces sp. NPDC059477 TaxID=3346847 RepID=UPI0036B59C3D